MQNIDISRRSESEKMSNCGLCHSWRGQLVRGYRITTDSLLRLQERQERKKSTVAAIIHRLIKPLLQNIVIGSVILDHGGGVVTRSKVKTGQELSTLSERSSVFRTRNLTMMCLGMPRINGPQ